MSHPTLDVTLDEALRLLAEGVADATSAFRLPTLATVTAAGTPDMRTVVLRTFDAGTRRVQVHTDARSAKYIELQAAPGAALHVWDSGRRLQVRLTGDASLHSGDTTAREAWEALSPLGRQVYRVRQTPGTVIADPSPTRFDEYPEAAGFAAFAVIELAIRRIETLRLDGHGQLRARFEWPDGKLTASWLVP